jgi:uncharacterized protein (DUF488 family)
MLYTIGHSTRSIDELVQLLKHYKVDELIDVRKIPRSGHNPQFNRENLATSLEHSSIVYRHEPELGGLRKPSGDSVNLGWRNPGFRGFADYMQTDQFSAVLQTLMDRSQDRMLCILCAEAVPWKCHRSLISDALTVHGASVRHIYSLAKAEPHRLSPFAKVEGTRITYPSSEPQQPSLDL